MTRQALGKGLGALIPDAAAPAAPVPASTSTAAVPATELPIDQIRSNPYQPRASFDDAKLDELARSIKASGVIQPIVVRRAPEGSGYQLIAGERRFLAAQRAGLTSIPVVVRQASRKEMLEFAVVENLQREDLNPIDEARAFSRMATEFDLTQEQIAARVGKDRTTVANAMRLLNLCEPVLDLVAQGALTTGHARCLLGIDSAAEQESLAQEVLRRRLSVREVEELMSTRRTHRSGRSGRRPRVHPAMAPWEDQLRHVFGTQVRIIGGTARGRIEISYFNENDLERILEVAGLVEGAPRDAQDVPTARPTIME
mgnify:CR=1 FL=1